ncbi:hypothetical protein EYF80_033921 [Liparis tanakae]|uniref:Uncharacterized protein n=1 Tax=Liparis tanakae TaxID=230148 RepID=A0A4Z2GST3_9TELE|nr:hypothetical protein EYF80_033921 [Liparis tanakae]
MMIQSKKEDFLNNKANKQRFIHYLSDKLERAGCSMGRDDDLLILHEERRGISRVKAGGGAKEAGGQTQTPALIITMTLLLKHIE